MPTMQVERQAFSWFSQIATLYGFTTRAPTASLDLGHVRFELAGNGLDYPFAAGKVFTRNTFVMQAVMHAAHY